MAPEQTLGAFSEDQASRITGVSLNQLRQWDKEGFFRPSYSSDQPHVPYGRAYSFRDLVSLQVLHDLRNEKRIPLGHLKKVSEKLAHLGESRWTAATLYVLGKRVVFDNPATEQREEIVSGQRVFNIPLRVVIRSTRRRIEALNDRTSKAGQFERHRFVAQNERVFAGTRIPVATVIAYLEAGFTVKKILAEFPTLEASDIEAASMEWKESAAA